MDIYKVFKIVVTFLNVLMFYYKSFTWFSGAHHINHAQPPSPFLNICHENMKK